MCRGSSSAIIRSATAAANLVPIVACGACPPPTETMSVMQPELTASQWCDWDRDGFVRLGVQLAQPEVEELRARCDALMLGTAEGVDYSQLRMVLEAKAGGNAVGHDIGHSGPSLEYQKFQGLEHCPVLRSPSSAPCCCHSATFWQPGAHLPGPAPSTAHIALRVWQA